LILSVSAFSLDFYTIKDDENKDEAFLFSPRKETLAKAFFTTQDIRHFAELVNKLRNGSDPLSKYLSDEFSPQTKALLNSDILPLSDKLKQAIVEELNKSLHDPNLFSDKRFDHVPLSQKARQLLDRQSEGDEKTYLNRVLLQEAYAKELTPWKGWEFIWDEVSPESNPDDETLYEKNIRPHWKRKIGVTELPYKYIERKLTEDSQHKNGDITIRLTDDGENELGRIDCNVNGYITPRTTGDYHEFVIKGNLISHGIVIGQIEGIAAGKVISKRVNFSLNIEIRNEKHAKIGTFNGSFAFGLSEKGDFENGIATFFARLNQGHGMQYGRISGVIGGNLTEASIFAPMIDVDGRLFGNIVGNFNIK